jgi:hypothetical protein
MPKPCPLELRERVNAVETGASRREAADWVDVSPSSANNGCNAGRRREDRSETERGQYLALGSARGLFVCVIARQPDLTLENRRGEAQAKDHW